MEMKNYRVYQVLEWIDTKNYQVCFKIIAPVNITYGYNVFYDSVESVIERIEGI